MSKPKDCLSLLHMAEIGNYNRLRVAGKNKDGMSLSDGENEILLPLAEVPANTDLNDLIRVFVFVNKAGQLVATTKNALAEVGDFAFLPVVDVSEDGGAYLSLGIDKDVYVPAKEQKRPMQKGESYVVYVYLDPNNQRMLASSRLYNFVEAEDVDVEVGDEVSLLISELTDLGFNAIINNHYIGLLYHNELFTDVSVGQQRKGWIKNIRIEGKIDLSLRPQGFGHVLDTKEVLLQALQEEGGVIGLGDRSTPEAIQARFQISKSAFKKAIGGLYKERLITLGDHEIRLIPQS
ncbi:hypothetical protein SAMN05216436_13114 [bacterium A37T11]|nr:hypothetical protein SAMN05216436_13114 [bacterium A37T11]